MKVLKKKTRITDKSFEKMISHISKKVFLFLEETKSKTR